MSSFWIRYFSFVAISITMLYSQAEAYEVATHTKISEEAAMQSGLESYLPAIGLNSLNDPLMDIGVRRSILDWIKLGADEEDDTISANFARYRNHFFDPQHGGAGYSYPLAPSGEPSPDWALEDTRSFLTQSYSFKDARQAFYDALTLPDKDNREQWMARTFYTLGHVIHLIQDAAQPQHTRNDSHGGGIFGPPSLYEKWTDRDTVRLTLPYTGYPMVTFATARKFWTTGDGKGMAEFSSYNFVSAGTNFRGAFQNGGLIARPSERYPLPWPSPATPTFHDANSLFAPIGKTPPAECAPPNNPCIMAFFSSEVKDNYRQTSQVNDRASTASIFDQDLQLYGKTVSYPNLDMCVDPSNPNTCEKIETGQIFSLNRFNFDEAHKFLIPRAVAYGAGLIDYFFRGKLEAVDVIFTDSGISLRVKNAIDPEKTPAWASEVLYAQNTNGSAGSLVIAFDYKDRTDTTQYGVSNVVALRTSDNLDPGQVSADPYNFSLTLPPDAKDIHYRLVFRGKLGQEEDAVAMGSADPISGFVFNPSYIPTDGVVGSRVIYQQSDQWRLTDQQNKVAGNIDWKGWYKNGKPTKVLSWVGPSSRYFPSSYLPSSKNYFGPVDNMIFQNGEIFALAPRPVLGAALTRDSAGREWLLAICHNGNNDVVYRRPNTKSDFPGDWQAIGIFSHDPALLNAPNSPWFFNGSGTEAQTIRSGYKTGDTKLRLFRLKISIVENSATFSNEGNLDDDANVGAFTATKECNNNLPPPGLCSANCSGGWTENTLSESQETVQIIWSGSSIIAVDYIEDTPILATYSSAANNIYILKASRESSYTAVCNGRHSSGACNINSSWEIRDTRHIEKNFSMVEKISISGFSDIILESTIGKLQLDATKTDVTSLPTLIDMSGGGSFQYTTSRLRYLDLRYALYSLRSETKESSGEATKVQVDFFGGPFSPPDGIFLPRKTTIKQVTGYGGTLPVHQIEQSEGVIFYDLENASLVSGCNKTVNNPGLSQPVFMDPSGIFGGGSWAVDSNENLFVSESKLDRDMRGIGAFNYLTGAASEDPASVIPTAPQGIYFYGDIGVVK